MTEYDFYLDEKHGTICKSYIARIVGQDPNYILKRRFEPVEYRHNNHCFAELKNGLYEACVSRFDKKTGERLERKRWWIIIIEDDMYEYDFEEMNWQYALFVAFNIRANSAASLKSAPRYFPLY